MKQLKRAISFNEKYEAVSYHGETPNISRRRRNNTILRYYNLIKW